MQYYAKEFQDKFAHKLIGGRGCYLDLGSHHPFEGNNTAALEWLGWKGISVDFQQRWIDLFNKSDRRNECIKADVTVQSFIEILDAKSNVKHFDYISLDVDDASIPCLELLISNGYTFDFMTFEHDSYADSEVTDARKKDSIKILEASGYKMLFEDVLTDGTEKYDNKGNSIWEPWEDWWVGEKYFSELKNKKSKIKYIDTV